MMARIKPSEISSVPYHDHDDVNSNINEWGVPDWRDKSAYGDTSKWCLGRWRWEFYRRLADVRDIFDTKKYAQYEFDYGFWKIACNRPGLAESERDAILRMEPVKPEHPKFVVRCNAEERARIGYSSLHNPRIGDISRFDEQDKRRDSCIWFVEGTWLDGNLPEMPLERNEVVVAFSIDRPLSEQLKDVERALKSLQKDRHGRHLQKRRHLAKWLRYLRVLDAREGGATWAEIAETFYSQGLLGRHRNPSGGYCPPPPQAARDLWEAAQALRFNF